MDGDHFDVHRFHPPLIYGRRGGPDDGEGVALCRVEPKEKVGDGTLLDSRVSIHVNIVSSEPYLSPIRRRFMLNLQ